MTFSGPSSTQCIACSWVKGTVLDGNNACTKSCNANGQYTMHGQCYSCPGGCADCQYGICTGTACQKSEFLFIDQQVCCDLGKNKYFDGTNCVSCHESCEKCTGPTLNDCLTCPSGYAMDPVQGVCVASCDGKNGKFVEGGQCRDCPTGCKECVSSTMCLVCDSQSYLMQPDHSCLHCATNKNKFINNQNYPPTCDSCEANCLECSDANTCTKCDTPQGFYLSSGDCLSCNLAKAKFIPSSGDSCQDCNIQNCLQCSDANTCTRCDPNGLHYIVNGGCQVCPINNGKFFNAGENPPTCDSCSPNCMECSDANTCTKCDTSKNSYLQGSQCTLCEIEDKKKVFVTTPQQSCLECTPPCLTCEGSPDNCLSYIPSKCGEDCASCSGSGSTQCEVCKPGKCQSVTGSCIDCPPETYVPSNPDSILQNASLTWSFLLITSNNLEQYYLTFSEQDIIFLDFDLYNLKKHMEVKNSKNYL